CPKVTPQPRRDVACLAPDRDRITVFVLDEHDQAAVAGQPLDRRQRQIRPPRTSAEGFFVDVDDDLIVVGDGGARRRRAFVSSCVRVSSSAATLTVGSRFVLNITSRALVTSS